MADLDRREFSRILLGSGLAACLPGALGCGSEEDPSVYSPEDAARLERQRAAEAAAAGKGPHGALRFQGYRGLAELPWFEVGADGRLRTTAELPGIIDIHAHFGMDFYAALDQTQRTERVEHLLDCDGTEPGCDLDLDVYVNGNFSEDAHAALPGKFLKGAFARGVTRTHTAANLLAEMDDVGVERAAVLPIAMGLPFAASLTEQWGNAIRENGWEDRLLPYASVNPNDADAPDQLRAYADAGAKGVKLHPEMQRFFPDASGAMAVYEVCRERKLPVVFHAGRSGIESEGLRKFALMRRYEPAAADFPEVRFVFGHGGARDLEEAIPIARNHRNVWLGISSLGVTQIARALETVGPDRMVFGSDWPFYHLAVTLAKILIVTRGDVVSRDALLRTSADELLA